jgi:hypothetical protein
MLLLYVPAEQDWLPQEHAVPNKGSCAVHAKPNHTWEVEGCQGRMRALSKIHSMAHSAALVAEQVLVPPRPFA